MRRPRPGTPDGTQTNKAWSALVETWFTEAGDASFYDNFAQYKAYYQATGNGKQLNCTETTANFANCAYCTLGCRVSYAVSYTHLTLPTICSV